MSSSMLLGLFSWIGDFFKALFDLIPKIMYLLYASFACLIDVMQLFFRKLAGLDVYYVKGQPTDGDIVTNFITAIIGINKNGVQYSTLTTVFWSFILFGIIVCFFATLIAIIKSHYTYDEKAAKGPMQYVYTAGKAIINMLAVPVIVVLGLYVSEALLEALDSITSTTSSSLVNLYGKDAVTEYLQPVNTIKSINGLSDEKTYIYYDIFGYGAAIKYGTSEDLTGLHMQALGPIGAKSASFSGMLFKVAAYNGNRARLGQMNFESTGSIPGYRDKSQFSGSKNDYTGNHLFMNAKDNDQLAEMIDTAFECNLHLKVPYKVNYLFDGAIVSFKYFTNFLCQVYWTYTKFNVGLVWYYYDLWQFNFLVGFAGCLMCVTIFVNIIMGLIARLFMCIVLFLIAPPLFGLAPLDGGGAAKKWREQFMKQVLMTYGAVVGMNLMLMILPYFNEIKFFNIGIADLLAQSLVLIVGLITIKAVIATLSELIGAADANKTGEGISKEVQQTAGKAAKLTAGAAALGVAGTALAGKGLSNLADSKFGQTGFGKVATAPIKGIRAAGSGIKSLGEKAGGLFGKIKGKITGDENIGADRQVVSEREGYRAIRQVMQSKVQGKTGDSINLDEVRAELQKKGVSGAQLENAMKTIRQTADSAGSSAVQKTDLFTNWQTNDKKFNEYTTKHGITQIDGRGSNSLTHVLGGSRTTAGSIREAQQQVKTTAARASRNTMRRETTGLFTKAFNYIGDSLKMITKPVFGEGMDTFTEKDKNIKKDEAAARNYQKFEAEVNALPDSLTGAARDKAIEKLRKKYGIK